MRGDERQRGALTGTPILRADIQALRALAVGLVVCFHVWPEALTGGYVGVDVFFVISGFLMTAHLLREQGGGARAVLRFWARRARRLLPAGLTVLAVTLAGARLLLPATQWQAAADQTVAAGLYCLNWVLASGAVDYLAADDAATPVQHYWSLSVEEQFYFIWPILLLLLLPMTGRRWPRHRSTRPTLAVGVVIAAVAVASLAWSVVRTANVPADAYFNTGTRLWEMAVGGLVAVLVTRRDGVMTLRAERLRAMATLVGLVAILVSAITYSGATPFPGWAAALPVGGTALVIAADPRPVGLSAGWMRVRPVQWLGDHSYGVYLWHWPLIVLWPHAIGAPITGTDTLTVLAVTLVLAAATKRWVEDPARTAHWARPTGRTLVTAAAAMSVVVSAGVGVGVNTRSAMADEQERAAQLLTSEDPCLGAAALQNDGCPPSRSSDLVLSPAAAAADRSDAYRGAPNYVCSAVPPDFESRTCDFGRRNAGVEVALVGNSHAAHWLPALQTLAARYGWRIRSYLVSACALTRAQQVFDPVAGTSGCSAWVDRTVAEVVAGRPDLVLVSNKVARVAAGETSMEASVPAFTRGFRPILEQWADAGLRVGVIKDTPAPNSFSVPQCLAEHGDDLSACGGPLEDWEALDPFGPAVAAFAEPGIRSIDLTNAICPDERCEAVVGNVIGWFDEQHLSATFARTLAPSLDRALERAGLRPPRPAPA